MVAQAGLAARNMVSTGVTVLGLGLVAANTLTGPNVKSVQGVLQGQGDPSKAHTALLSVGAQVLFVLVLAFLADWNADLGSVIVALLLGLWLVWAVGNASKIQEAGKFLGIGK